jgi:hypothetical protein
MVTVDDANKCVDASKLSTVSIEYHRILQITIIFSNLHKMGGK